MTAAMNGSDAPPMRFRGTDSDMTRCVSDSVNVIEGLGDDRQSLVKLAYRFCWNMDDAEDAVQNALVLAVGRQDQLRSRDRLWSWLRSIVVRQCQEIHRRKKRKRRNEEELRTQAHANGQTLVTDELGQQELDELLRSLINELPARQRTAITLRHLEGMEYVGIAETLGLSESTVRVHVRNARESLRRQLVMKVPDLSDLKR